MTKPTDRRRFAMDSDLSIVGLSDVIHHEKMGNGMGVLTTVCFKGKSLTPTRIQYGTLKIKNFTVVTFITNFTSYLDRGISPQESSNVVVKDVLAWWWTPLKRVCSVRTIKQRLGWETTYQIWG